MGELSENDTPPYAWLEVEPLLFEIVRGSPTVYLPESMEEISQEYPNKSPSTMSQPVLSPI